MNESTTMHFPQLLVLAFERGSSWSCGTL